MAENKIKVFVEGEVLVLDHFSGIGHYTAALLQEVDKLLQHDKYKHIEFEIGLPWKLRKRVERFKFKNFRYRRLPFMPSTSMQMKAFRLLPPIDFIYGKKIYVFPNYSSWPTAFSPQIPVIYDLSFELYPQFSAEKNRKFLTEQTVLSVKRATRVVTISKNSKKEIAEHYTFDADNIDIVIPVLDKTRFQPQPPEVIKQIRAKYSLFDDYILFVGNIEPRKNLVTLLKAYRQLPKVLQKKYALLLVGAKGWKDGEIHTLISDMQNEGLKVIRPAGYVHDEDLPALFSAARVFTYVSVYEGYGIPPTEAMACKTAVISSDNSSLPEAVEDAAVMVDALDVDAITKALEDVLSSKQLTQELIRKGEARVSRLDPRASAEVFLDSIVKCAKDT